MNIHTALTIADGRPVVSSRTAAEYFGKQHHRVVRDIRALIEPPPDLALNANFGEYSETVKTNDLGSARKVPVYWMDRKGFCILAMGFTGPKALEFKNAFYEQGKAIASQAGKTLPQRGRIKQPAEAQLRIMEDQIQLSIKFDCRGAA